MKVVIGGCGRVGALLAERLALEGNDVAVIDVDSEAFERLGATFRGSTHVGSVFEREVLEAAGIAYADAYVAVTSGDNVNTVSTILAREEYRVPRVLARIYDPKRAEIYRRLGIPAVSSSTWLANEVLAVLLHPRLKTERTFGDGEVRLVSIEVPHRFVGRRVDEVVRAAEVVPVAVVRAGRSFLPSDASVFAERDILYAAVADAALERFERMVEE